MTKVSAYITTNSYKYNKWRGNDDLEARLASHIINSALAHYLPPKATISSTNVLKALLCDSSVSTRVCVVKADVHVVKFRGDAWDCMCTF